MSPYIFILAFFTLAGLAMAAWGWSNLVKGRRTRHWLKTTGRIEESALAVDESAWHVAFSYTVADETYRSSTALPTGGDAPGLASRHAAKFPVGARVPVYYDPSRPATAALERHEGRDDWLIFAIGMAAALFGLGAIFLNG